MSKGVLIAVCLLCSTAFSSDDGKTLEKPTSSAAVSALKEYDKAVDVAEKAYRSAKLAAERKLIERLKAAMVAATKAGNLQEANAIDSQVKMAMSRCDELTAQDKAMGITYTAWQFEWPGGSMKDWMLSDGTLYNAKGDKGTWTKEGNVITLDWNGVKDKLALSEDGKKLSGEKFGSGLRGTMIGTNLTGAPPPPTHQ